MESIKTYGIYKSKYGIYNGKVKSIKTYGTYKGK